MEEKKSVSFSEEYDEERSKLFQTVFHLFGCFEVEYDPYKNVAFHTKMMILRDYIKKLSVCSSEEFASISKWNKDDLMKKLDEVECISHIFTTQVFANLYSGTLEESYDPEDSYDMIIQLFEEGEFKFIGELKMKLAETEDLVSSDDEESEYQEEESSSDSDEEEVDVDLDEMDDDLNNNMSTKNDAMIDE